MQNTDKKPNDRKQNTRRQPRVVENDGIDKKLVNVNRVTKVVKGGRTMRFAALVVVGDKNGKVGIGTGKAAEVPNAIEKATARAKKDMVKIALDGTTIPHEVIGKFGRCSVKMLPSAEGTGVIAGGSVRAILELAGIRDVVSKSLGARTKLNMARAAMNALKSIKTPEQVAALRGKTVEEILG